MKTKDSKNNLFRSILLWFLIGFLSEAFKRVFKMGQAVNIYGNNFIATGIFRGIFAAVIIGIPYYLILRRRNKN